MEFTITLKYLCALGARYRLVATKTLMFSLFFEGYLFDSLWEGSCKRGPNQGEVFIYLKVTIETRN